MGSREQLDARIRTFATEIEDLIRRATEEGIKTAIANALATGQLVKPSAAKAATPAPVAKSGKKVAAVAAPKAAQKPAKPTKPAKVLKTDKRKKGQKRSPEELAALEAKLEAFIQANGGKRIEEIGKELSIATSELAGPVTKMLDACRIRSTGERRATRYYPSKKK